MMNEAGDQEWTDDSITAEEQKAINALRERGFTVVMWTPTEVGDASGDDLESIVIERGNIYLEQVNGTPEEEEENE